MQVGRFRRLACATLVSGTVAACAGPQATATNDAAPSPGYIDASVRPQNAQVPATAQANYTLGPEDTIAVNVFGVPQLSQTVQVNDAGAITLPLIGQVPAAGRTTTELGNEIAAKLNESYVKDPVVTVVLNDAASQKITVAGSVTQPGVYQIRPGTTLSQAIALARGPDNVADIHEVAIIRNTPSGRKVSTFDLDDVQAGNQVDPLVHANDEVVVGVSGSRKFVRDFGSVISVLGWLRP